MTPHDKLRHDLRGRFNGLKLCVSALACSDGEVEILEFIDNIELAAEKVMVLVENLERELEASEGVVG